MNPEPPLNVLLILTDQQHAQALGSAGNPVVQTPNLDRLAEQGSRFTQHCTPCALCTPARASILSGLYPRSHGAWHVGTTLDRRIPTLADILSEQGYRCGFFGKCHLEGEKTGHADWLSPEEPYYGFQEHALAEDAPYGAWWQWICREHPEYRDQALSTLHEAFQEPPLKKGGGLLESAYGVDLPEELSHSYWITDQTLGFMARQAERGDPFVSVCSFVDPHHPWTPVGKWAEMYDPAEIPVPGAWDQGPPDMGVSNYCFEANLPLSEYQRMMALYYGMISHIDEQVARLLQQLEDLGLEDNTLVMFSSDHGDHVGNRQLIRKSGLLTWDLMNVPLLIRSPKGVAGQVVDHPTQHEDLLPTILELAGIPVPAAFQGYSFRGTLMEGASPSRSYHYFVHDSPQGQHWGVSDGKRKLTRFPQGVFRLTEIAEDPYELEAAQSRVPDSAGDLALELGDWLMRTAEYRAPKTARW